MPPKTSFQRFFRKVFIILALFAGVILGGVGIYEVTTIFTITHVEVEVSDEHPSIIGLNDVYKQNILFLDEKSLEDSLKAKNPYIKSVTVQKVYPNELFLNLTEYKPLSYIAIANGFILVSVEGDVLEKMRSLGPKYPVIHFYQEFNYDDMQAGDDMTDSDLLFTLKILKKMEDIGITIDSIDINSSHVIACNGEGKTFVFTSDRDITLQEYQVETIVKQFKIEGKAFVKLDVRFDKPVIEIKK